ncbi:MAG: hypothetical protein APF76_00735 [Desulfitibacter sp. BRH_c19]|nr:MAG: hypothetical protein APF76_00735 [Desulfitibacter sp. BRH_c19]
MNLQKHLNKITSKINITKEDANRLYLLSKEYDLPSEVLYGIYLIEITYRPTYYRIGEYIVVVFRLILSVLFKVPIKNYTIGKCQIGLGTIISYYGYTNANVYSKEIYNVTLEQAIIIIKCFMWDYNSRVFAWRLRVLFVHYNTNDFRSLVRNIGHAYNGKLVYGLVLEKLIETYLNRTAFNNLTVY